MNYLSFSSEIYCIKSEELKKLDRLQGFENIKFSEVVILLDEINGNKIIANFDILDDVGDEEFIKTRVAYHTFNPFVGFLITLIKPIKRKFYTRNEQSFTVSFDKLLDAKLTRGERNRENAYQWTNKKWKISREDAAKKYEELYNSLKENGYDKKSPMFVMLNRKLGVKDQILQGHHRIGICKELGLKTVNVAFWTVPTSLEFFKIFTK
jgi:hypothetical protein